MRFLVACPACRRQYDASELPLGSRFHCLCGETVKVPAVKAGDAAVVRCGSCGGPRQKDAAACTFCGADFTLNEQDLQTLCASCMARVSNRARFCHHCGTRISPQGQAGERSECSCPACGDRQRLNHRTLGDPPAALLECPRCAGLWLGQDVFQGLVERARAEQRETAEPRGALEVRAPAPQARRRQQGPLYRQCPVCSRHMHRRNWGGRSGVIVDHCKDHGIWLDARELEQIFAWIRSGAEERTRLQLQEEQRLAASSERFRVQPKTADGTTFSVVRDRDDGFDLIGGVLGSLFDL